MLYLHVCVSSAMIMIICFFLNCIPLTALVLLCTLAHLCRALPESTWLCEMTTLVHHDDVLHINRSQQSCICKFAESITLPSKYLLDLTATTSSVRGKHCFHGSYWHTAQSRYCFNTWDHHYVFSCFIHDTVINLHWSVGKIIKREHSKHKYILHSCERK